MIGIAQLPLIWCGAEEENVLLSELMRRPDGSGEGADSPLPRTLIVAGVKEQELHVLMSGCRQAGMQQALWATLTPTSETWPLKRLLSELSAEKEALTRR